MWREPGSSEGTLTGVTRLHLHSFGDDLASVLLLHGLGSAGPVWWRIGGDLADDGHSCIAPDLRGHGESSLTAEYSLDGYARDVTESCPGPWDLVIGHSLGGAVAVRAAATEPGFSRAYLLIDPAINLDATAIRELRFDLAAEAENPPSVDQLIDDHPKWHREDCILKHAAVRATSPEVMAATFDDNSSWTLGNEMAALTVPIHILGAESDPLYTSDDFERHAPGGSKHTFEVIPATGHSIYRDDPATVVDRAQAMLKGT